MPHVKLFGPTVLCSIDDDFELPGPKKSIAKKAEHEIVLSRTGAMLNVVERHLDPNGAARRRRQGVDRQSEWTGL